MQTVQFIKMEGIGNDYVFVDQAKQAEPIEPTAAWIQRIADRHIGVGGDGLVLIEPSDKAAARMVMFNSDGSRSAMCGNALRCIGLYVYQNTSQQDFLLESDIGLHAVRVFVDNQKGAPIQLEVNQGPPIFKRDQIPYKPAGPEPALDILLQLDDRTQYQASILSMGNPHCVIFVDNADGIDLEKVGPLIETHPDFPERTNVEFVSQENNGRRLYQRTWERGSGETLACGSGACAVAVAAILSGRFEQVVPIRLRGGLLELSWDGRNNPESDVYLRGPARIVFEGSYTAPQAGQE